MSQFIAFFKFTLVIVFARAFALMMIFVCFNVQQHIVFFHCIWHYDIILKSEISSEEAMEQAEEYPTKWVLV